MRPIQARRGAGGIGPIRMDYVNQEIDPLTRLPGCGAFLERLGDETARAERYGRNLSLLLADVDGWAALTAARGSETGDAILCHLALVFLSSVRDTDTVARIGRDKFAILLPDTDGQGARTQAERLAAAVGRADVGEDGEGVPLRVSVSVGVAVFGPGLAEDAALLSHAEEALRDAKRRRRDVAPPDQSSGASIREFAQNGGLAAPGDGRS